MEKVWVVFGIRREGFPNFYPLGIFEKEEDARKQLDVLPKSEKYQLFKLPLNRFLGYLNDEDKVESKLGVFHHEHFEPDEDDSSI